MAPSLDIHALVARQLPGVTLESPIQGWAYLGRFEQGISEHARIARPTGHDDRWLGVCYFQTFEDMRAQEAFYRALAKGVEAARINLAHLLRFLERSDEAQAELARVDLAAVTPYDRVLYHRVRSLHEESNGDMRTALQFGEAAWRLAQAIPERSLLAPQVLTQLGVLYARTGSAQRSLWLLERAIALAAEPERQKVQLRRTAVLLMLGRNREALNHLLPLEVHDRHEPEKKLLIGEALWADGRIDAAIERYRAAVCAAQSVDAGAEEFLARLALATLHGATGAHGAARGELESARVFISDRSDLLQHHFRKVLVDAWSGVITEASALGELEMLAAEFEEMGLQQEEGWVRLHVGELSLSLGTTQHLQELDRLEGLCAHLETRAFLAKEWRLVPRFHALVARQRPQLLRVGAPLLEVRSLGEQALLLDGVPISLPARRSVELLCYLIEHRAVAAQQLWRDVFPDHQAPSFRSYLHRFRRGLRERVPGLDLEFDREARLYHLRSDLDILWDVAEVRAGTRPANGPFLQGSSSAWARQLDADLPR